MRPHPALADEVPKAFRRAPVALGAVFLAFQALAATVPAYGQTRSHADCERLADPHRYNSCLASFGPAARRAHTVSPTGDLPLEDLPNMDVEAIQGGPPRQARPPSAAAHRRGGGLYLNLGPTRTQPQRATARIPRR